MTRALACVFFLLGLALGWSGVLLKETATMEWYWWVLAVVSYLLAGAFVFAFCYSFYDDGSGRGGFVRDEEYLFALVCTTLFWPLILTAVLGERAGRWLRRWTS